MSNRAGLIRRRRPPAWLGPGRPMAGNCNKRRHDCTRPTQAGRIVNLLGASTQKGRKPVRGERALHRSKPGETRICGPRKERSVQPARHMVENQEPDLLVSRRARRPVQRVAPVILGDLDPIRFL